jgi:hypothetical protein
MSEDMKKLYTLIDQPIHSLDESLRRRLMSADVQLMQKALSTPSKDIPDCTMRAIASSLDRCITDPEYIFELEFAQGSEYDTLKTYPMAILKGIGVLFSVYSDDKQEDNIVKERVIEELRKGNKMDVLDFKLSSHAFDKFAASRGFTTKEKIREYASDLRIELDYLLLDREVTSDLVELRDFFIFLDKYASSPSFRLTCW